jgi:hypothetical protein
VSIIFRSIFVFVFLCYVVHYKFKASSDYDSVTFDGGFISVIDLKKAIVEKKKLGHSADFDLRVTDAQSGQG